MDRIRPVFILICEENQKRHLRCGMIQIIRYIKGYLAIRVFGFSPERFMNLCSHHNIFLWDVENHGDYYAMKISLKGFYRLRGITRKTGTRVVITRRYGLDRKSVV